jgi:NADP-dependent 3-hydroxy acid dehydrogenase YdfG
LSALDGVRDMANMPLDLDTELVDRITEPDIREGVRKMTDEMALPAETFARMVAFAMSQPEEVDVNEILYRPRARSCRLAPPGPASIPPRQSG